MTRSRAQRRRTLVVTDPIDEEMSELEKERAARRNLVATTGRCPCGATFEMPEFIPGTVMLIRVEHEPDCPAVDRDDPTG